MKPSKGWVWETTNSKKFISHAEAIQYSTEQQLDVSGIKKARAHIWITEDDSKFLDYDKAFDHESNLMEVV